MDTLNPSTVFNARQAFLGQEELSLESAIDAAAFLDLDLTYQQLVSDLPAVRDALDREKASSASTPSRNTEYFVAARQVLKIWLYTSL